MDSSLAIELKHIKKSFKVEVEDVYKNRTILNKIPTKTTENIVLDDINIQVKKGELLGVIGLNGSGKSTLLSIMAKIMEPDSGTVETFGKVSSILELGMGFHSDLSGRENIYIKGEMYGFTKKQMDERVEKIIDFSGIRNYIDNPLRTYSTGMSGRLAFSIMIHVDADIMILDEIMSTGDPSFSNKASNLFKRQLKDGKAVVFASQSTTQLEQLCTRIIWISKGKIVADGPPKSVITMFQNSINDSVDMIIDYANSGIPDAQYKLALLYRDGNKINKDEGLYKVWLSKAASQGHVLAQVTYADLLMLSDSEQDISEAFAYYQSAALKGNVEAKAKLSSMYGDDVSNIELKELRRLVRDIAEFGNPSHKLQVANIFLLNPSSAEDKAEAIRWLNLSIEEGNPNAMFKLATLYRDGIGVPKDDETYVKYLERAAELDHLDSIKALAEIYLNGKITVKDDKKALDYYLRGS